MTPPQDDARKRPEWLRILLAAAGTLSLVLGIIGMLLPVMPTTPFLLLAAACYLRSSKKLYDWMHTNRLFGSYMRGYRDGNGIPPSMKIATLSILWTTMLVSGFMFVPDRLWWVRIILAASGASVTVHILRLKTAKGEAGDGNDRKDECT